MDPVEQLVNAFGQTWIGDLVRGVVGNLPIFVGIAVVLVVVYLGYWLVLWTANGQGQLGIIEGYVGTIGAGKTTLAVQHSLELARMRDAVLLGNIPVVCGPGCKEGRHELTHELLPMTDDGIDLDVLLRRAYELRDQERGLVLLVDEVGVVMPSRLWKDFSVSLMWMLQQSRKLATEWVWTAQDPKFVDLQLRSLTSGVHYIRSYPPPSVWRRVHGKRPWVLVDTIYLPGDAPAAHGTAQDEKKDRRLGRTWHRYRRAWEGAFDTDGVVLPSRHLKGAEVVIAAATRTGDRHVLTSGDWGPGMGGSEEPAVSSDA